MPKSEFSVPLADLEWGPKSVTWPLRPEWLELALSGTEATPRPNPGSLSLELMKQGKEVIVRGHADVHLSMPCVVTLDPLDIDLNPEIFLMLAPAAPGAHTPRKERPARAEATKGGAQRHKASKSDAKWTEDLELTDEDAARDTYEGSEIVLDSFIREFILLELPMYPRRSDLPSVETPANPPPSAETEGESPSIDPRLKPLADIKSRLKKNQE